MSGAIDRFKEENKEILESSSDNQAQTLNLAIRLTSYEDGKYFCGNRIDNNEYVKIFLRPVEQKGEYSRIGFEKLSNPKDYKNFVDPSSPDSILLFESCYQDSEDNNNWNSRWVKVLSKPKKKAKVFSFASSVKLVEHGEYRFFAVEAIKGIKRVSDENTLKNEVVKGLRPKMKKMDPMVVVRFTDSIGSSITHKFFVKKEKVNDEKMVMQPEEYIEEYWGHERFQKLLELMNDPTVTVEVILLTTMTFGADTNTKMLKDVYEINRIKKEYKDVNGKDLLYKNTILTLREREDGTLFLISASPFENNKKGLKIENI